MPEPAAEPTYTLYRRGMELLADGDFEHATAPLAGAGVGLLAGAALGPAPAPLAEAARREPEKTSVREALGRAYFRAGRFRLAAREFDAEGESHPVHDSAHFCL